MAFAFVFVVFVFGGVVVQLNDKGCFVGIFPFRGKLGLLGCGLECRGWVGWGSRGWVGGSSGWVDGAGGLLERFAWGK